MADNSFAFIQAVFHVVLFIVIHGRRAGIKARAIGTKPNQKSEIKNRKFFNP